MKKMKKTFLGVILSCLMAVCLCVGVTFIKVKTTIASANATFTETSISVRRYADKRLMLNVEGSDLLDAAANTHYAADAVSELNTFDYVLVNGKSMRELGVTGFYVNLYAEAAIAFDGVTLSTYDTVTVKEGAQVPSAAYLQGTSNACYIATSDVLWTHDGSTWGVQHLAFTETNTTIVSLTGHTNNHIGFELATSDYETNNQIVTKDALAKMNTLSSITYNGKTLGSSLIASGDTNVYLRLWTNANKIYFPMAAPAAGDVVKIAAGTQFPTNAYASNATQTAYVIPYEIVYKYNGSAWVVDYSNVTFAQTETVANVENYANNRLKIALSVSDYANATNNEAVYTNTDKFAAFNTLIKITVNGTPLKDVTASSEAAFLQMWGQPALWVNMPEPTAGTKVSIPAGTQFPSSDFIFNGATHCYVTTKDSTWTYDGAAWVKEIVFESTNTVASVGDYANNRLKIALSVSDYANAPNNTFTLNEEQFNALNTLTNITVNGTTLAELWNGDIAFMQMWGQPALWVPIMAPTAGTVVVIPAGTQFPSYAYMNAGTATCYTTSTAIAYKYDGSTWKVDYSNVDFAEEVTSISDMEWISDVRLMVSITPNDYGTATENYVNQNVSNEKLSALNTLDNILVDGNSLRALGITTADLNYWTYWGRFTVALSTAPKKVVFQAGTQIPSMAFVKDNVPSCYVIEEAIAFKYENGMWSETVVEEPKTFDTSIVSVTPHTNNHIGLGLSTSDYTGGTLAANDAIASLNTLTNITYNGKTLKDSLIKTGDENIYLDMWGNHHIIYFPMSAPTEDDVISIPAGTQFPSYLGASGGLFNTYVTTEDVTYTYMSGTWGKKIDWVPTAATASVLRIGDQRLMLSISGSDYANASPNTSFDVNKLAQLNTLDYILLNGAPLSSLGLSEYFVNLYDSGAIAFGKISVANGDVLTIKVGAQFPSYAFINTGVDSCYVTQKEVSFKYQQVTATGDQLGDWSEVVIFEETPTTIQKVVFNDTKEDANNVLYLWLSNHDYGNTEGTVDVSGGIGKLNTYDYIEVDGVKLSNLSIGDIAINFFERWGALGIRLNDYGLENEPSYIYLKAGCQIPSLSFAKDGSVTSVYVIEEDTWIVYNDYYDNWEIMTQKPENIVEVGDILPVNESMVGRVFLGWELNGELYKGGAVAPTQGIAKAVYLDYTLEDGASIRMADTAEESGIRFTSFLQEEGYVTYSKYIHSVGIIVLPLELLGSEAFEVNHSAGAVNFYASQEKGFTFADGVMTMRATIQTVRATNYNRDYAARVYVRVNYAGGETDYAYGYFQKENHVRNIYEVATEAYKAGEGTSTQRTVLKGYAGKIVDLTFDGKTFTATDGTIDSALTAIQTVAIEDGIVRLALTSDGESEPLLIINGEPIRNAAIFEKTYENNLFTISFIYETSVGLTYYASDAAMEKFFQDYFELYSMAGAYAVTHSGVSDGPTYQQDWYMNAMAWFKATNLIANNSSANENATYSAEDYALFYLKNIDVDKNGNVYSDMNDKSPNTPGNGPAYTTVTSYYLMNSQGWPLPHMESKGWEGYHAEFNNNVADETLKAEMNSQTDYYKTAYENSSKWKVNGGSITQTNGVAAYTGTAKTNLSNVTGATNAIVYEATGLSYSSYNAPFVEVRLLIDDPNKVITDYAIEWQTGGVWYSVTQSEYANNPYDMPNATGMYRSYFPLYTHANYGAGKVVYGNDNSNAKTITGLRVVLLANNTTSNVTVGLDYVRATADSRHSVNGPKYIISLNEYAANHNDLGLLAKNITRARKAMLFQLKPLQGVNGLVNLSYLHRHDSYEGAANNFWDIYPAGNLNMDANIYFYEALLALAEMEEVLAAKGISVAEEASIEWHDLNGAKQTATYAETADSLRTLAATVKTNIQNTFYNATTGRFAWSVRDVASEGGKAAGSLMDYGFTEINLRAIEAGIATDAQATSIMQWISGARPVNGDKVTGGGIYEQPFAPVTTTVDNKKYSIDGFEVSGVVESDFTTFYYDEKFGVLCQDGGTIMHVSYYDVLARAKILGVDNAYTRMTAIKDWFVAVQAKNPNAASTGWSNFFKNYYTASGALQGSEAQGKYGLQDEFKEAVMLIAAAPKIFLGLEAHYDTLTIAPNLGSNLTYFGMENLSFGGNTYACRAEKDSITLSRIHRNVNSGLQVTLKLAYTAGQSVYLNGKVLNASAYTIENGYVIVTTDFANLTLQVK